MIAIEVPVSEDNTNADDEVRGLLKANQLKTGSHDQLVADCGVQMDGHDEHRVPHPKCGVGARGDPLGVNI